jgi:hypothetical protein
MGPIGDERLVDVNHRDLSENDRLDAMSQIEQYYAYNPPHDVDFDIIESIHYNDELDEYLSCKITRPELSSKISMNNQGFYPLITLNSCKYVNVKSLSITNTYIHSIIELDMPNLEVLELNGTETNSLKFLKNSKIPKLRVLSVNNCGITTIKLEGEALSDLEIIFANNNPITLIDIDLNKAKKLKYIVMFPYYETRLDYVVTMPNAEKTSYGVKINPIQA